MESSALQYETYPVGHLPVVRAVMDQLGLIGVIDGLLPKDSRARVSDGQCVAAMVLNILSGRMALFRMDEWLRQADTELLVLTALGS